jgi:hypothetical protein
VRRTSNQNNNNNKQFKMSARRLRSGTRKNYKKMAGQEVVDESAGSATDLGDVMEELLSLGDPTISEDSLSESVDEGEILAIEEEINSLKLQEEKQRRRSVHRELKKEAEIRKRNVEDLKNEAK